MFNKPRDTHVNLLYQSLHTLPIPALHEFKILIFVHNFIYNKHLLPDVFQSYFTFNSSIHNYSTRRYNDLFVNASNTRFGERNIVVKGCKLWNKLPHNIKTLSCPYKFKLAIKDFLLV